MAATRRLAAIMFTDMVGSTAAAQANEAGALRLRDEQADLVRPLFAAHHGREIKSMGDGFLAEFDSALHAVQCAVDIQQHLHERNSQPGSTAINLRIGIHLGDVEQRETDIFGDAVNIASRIEPLASPGGVCISGEVASQVRNKIPNKLEKLAPAPLKGLQVSIDLYQVMLPWSRQATGSEDSGPTGIAILPFTNISPDPKDEYFAEGLTEELITVLSQVRELRVIARTSVTPYKATTKGVAQIGAELGVSSILEGSVRKAGTQLRVTAQLIDVATQGHVWANSYNRELNDVFAVQAELAKQVVDALKIELRASESARLGSKPTVQPDSYLAYLRGRALFTSTWTKESFLEAQRLFKEALVLDPNNARAHSGLADVTRYLHYWMYPDLDPDWDSTSRVHAARAIEIDPGLAEGHCTLGSIHWDNFEYVEAEREMRFALELNPSYAQAHQWFCSLLMDEARLDEALREAILAEQLDPQSPPVASWVILVLILLHRLEEVEPRLARLRELDHEGSRYLESLSYYHYARGDFEEGARVTERLSAVAPRRALTERVWHLSASGKTDSARELAKEQETMAEPLSHSSMAAEYALVGDLDSAFRHLETAVAEHNVSLQLIRNEPTLEPLRRDPRFKAILKKMNLG